MSALFTILISNKLYSQNRRFEIDRIQFIRGNDQSISDEQLNKAITCQRDGSYSYNFIKKDTKRLKKFYYDHGYFDVSVNLSTDTSNRKKVTLKFTIISGNKYGLTEIKTTGIKSDVNLIDAINKIAEVHKGDFYIRDSIVIMTDEMLEYLHNKGYRYAELNNKNGTVVEINKKNFTTKVTLNFTKADTVTYFGSPIVEIKENFDSIDTCAIYEAVKINPGYVYSPKTLYETNSNLNEYAIIKNVDFENTNKNYEKINISLNKRDELFIYGKVAYGDYPASNHKIYAGLGFGYYCRYLPLFTKPVTFRLEPNILFNFSGDLIINLTSKIDFPRIAGDATDLSDETSAGYYKDELYKYFSLNNLISYNSYKIHKTFIKNSTILKSDDWVWQYITTGNTTTIDSRDITPFYNSSIGWTLGHDKLDNTTFYPISGIYHSISVQYAGVIPDLLNAINEQSFYYSRYLKFYIAGELFCYLNNRRTSLFGSVIKLGDIIEIGGGHNVTDILRIYRFFSGGGNSLRGWDAQQNGILDNTTNGGNFLFEGAFEFRQMLFPDSKGFWGNAGITEFLDYGNVWEDIGKFRISQIAFDIGTGVYFTLGHNTLRLDVGFRIYDPSASEGNKWLFPVKNKFGIHFALVPAF